MNFDPLVSNIAKIISDKSRSTMLLTLLDGRKYTVSELALVSKVTPQTASFHLGKMSENGIVKTEKIGRHRYISIYNSEVARVLESLLSITPQRKPNSFKEVTRSKEIHFARTCYDHIAGTLGVAITNSLLDQHYITDERDDFSLTLQGEMYLSSLGIDLQQVRKKRRSFSCKCLDWSERKYHLAGALGNSILLLTLDRKWVERLEGTRALKLTKMGKENLIHHFGLSIFDE